MRVHTGWHEVNGQLDELLQPCGYCGRQTANCPILLNLHIP